MEALTPLGLLRPEDAILEVAKAAEPYLWAEDAMTKEEVDIWYGLNIDFDGKYLIEKLDILQASIFSNSLRERQASFEAALSRLKNWLHCGIVRSCVLDDDWHSPSLLDAVSDDGIDLPAIDEKLTPRTVGYDFWSLDVSKYVLLTGKYIDTAASKEVVVFIDLKTFEDSLKSIEATRPDETSNISALPVAAYKTGAPGRPTAMDLIVDEFRRRREQHETAATLRDEAGALFVWCKTHHPNAPRPSGKTIENRLRAEYRAACPPKL